MKSIEIPLFRLNICSHICKLILATVDKIIAASSSTPVIAVVKLARKGRPNGSTPAT